MAQAKTLSLRDQIHALCTRMGSRGIQNILKDTFQERAQGKTVFEVFKRVMKHAKDLPWPVEVEMLRFAHFLAHALRELVVPLACVQTHLASTEEPSPLEISTTETLIFLDETSQKLLGELWLTLKTHELSDPQKVRVAQHFAAMQLGGPIQKTKQRLDRVTAAHTEAKQWLHSAPQKRVAA